MKRQNIVPAIIMLAAIMLSTFVLADTPVIPGDATTSTSDEPSETPDEEVVVEAERDEDRFPWLNDNECVEQRISVMQDRVASEAEAQYRNDLYDAEREYYDCRGCTLSYHTIDCRTGHQPGSSEYAVCWKAYEEAREVAHEKYEETLSDAILTNWFNCLEEGILEWF